MNAMISTAQWSSLLAKLYAAPLEPGMWQVFLDDLSQVTEISCSYLVGSTSEGGNSILAGGGSNFDPEALRLYNEHYSVDDPYRAPLLTKARTGLLIGEELLPHRTLIKTRIYNELLRRYELEHMNMLSCTYRDGNAEVLSLWRDRKRGPMDHASNQLLETLVPHMQTALGLRTRLLDLESHRVFSETALDAMSIPALLVTDLGRVIHINQTARNLIVGVPGLKISRGELRFDRSEKNSQLQNLIRAVCSQPSPIIGLPMKVEREQSSVVLTVIPAPHDSRINLRGRCALIFLSAPEAAPVGRSSLLRQLYGLSPAECRLADMLLEGHELNACAEKLRLTKGTARFHLKKIFEKTGTRRQTSLQRLMLSLPAPSILR